MAIDFKELRAQILKCEELIHKTQVASSEMETRTATELAQKYEQNIRPALREMREIGKELLKDGIVSANEPYTPRMWVGYRVLPFTGLWFNGTAWKMEFMDGGEEESVYLPVSRDDIKIFARDCILTQSDKAKAEFVRHWEYIEPLMAEGFEQWVKAVLNEKADRVIKRYNTAMERSA